MHTTLERLGWTPEREVEFEQHRAAGLVPARVAVEHRSAYVLLAEEGEVWAELAGSLRHAGEQPAVGDWVALRPPATVAAVLPRRTAISRKEAFGRSVEQVLAANVDVVFIVSSLVDDLNLRRLERYLATAWESGAEPVVVLTKRDLADDPLGAVLRVEEVAIGVPVHAISSVSGEGVDELRRYLVGHRTAALIGSSGVGKSTLVNRLVERQHLATQAVREDGRGRHTTSHRELVELPGGGLVVDTPGLRELQLWDAGDGLETTFDDVAALAAGCRFTDCAHETEPGCAVREAIAAGTLDATRLESFRKLERELARLARRVDSRLLSESRKALRADALERRRTQRPPRRRA